MDNNRSSLTNTILILGISLITMFSVNQQDINAGFMLFEENESDRNKKRKAVEQESLPFMKNIYRYHEGPQSPLEYRDRFGMMTEDINRQYCKKLTHMYSWEIVELAEILKDDIEAPRETSWRPDVINPHESRMGRPPKYDHLNRLLFVLEWLSSGEVGDKAEFEKGYAKTSCVEDKKHILRAINRRLLDEIKWPNPQERIALYASYNGIFKNVVGILDVTEHEICKPKDKDKEQDTFSGKAKANTMKTLAVIDKYGYFIYVDYLAMGRRNDRDQWTSCDLYMNCGDYLSPGEKIASDGGFRGDGPQLISYDILDTQEKIDFNLAFKEVRVGVENAFGRVQMWFPILGVEKKFWTYDLELLELAVGAATKLHNWMLRNRGLSYNAQDHARNHYTEFY